MQRVRRHSVVTVATLVHAGRCKAAVGNTWGCWLENHQDEVVGGVEEEQKRRWPVGS